MNTGAAPGDFAVVLRRLRESRSLTQEELAERSGLTAKAIGALERGERRRPYPHTVRSLADGLALDDDERASLVAAVPSRDAVPRPRSAASTTRGPAVQTHRMPVSQHPLHLRRPSSTPPRPQPRRRRRSSGGMPRSTGCVR